MRMKKGNTVVATDGEGNSGSSSSNKKHKQRGGDDGDETPSLLGKWQFSVESETDTNVFAAKDGEDREGWLRSLLAASSYCHAISDARLHVAKDKQREVSDKLKKAEKQSEVITVYLIIPKYHDLLHTSSSDTTNTSSSSYIIVC